VDRSVDTPGFGLDPGELRLVAVGPDWALRFEEERRRLAVALGSAVLDIQHIGSTALPGILAKPILDLAIAVRCFEEAHSLVPRLVALGYEYRGEHGIARRHYFVRGNPRRSHHLHVLEQQGEDWERHLRFRDRLLASPGLAARYSAIKLEGISRAAGDRGVYQSFKSSFIAAHMDRNVRS
jgi:GrpB-like predicted nucleotidyltransferase (UPF0157 family)